MSKFVYTFGKDITEGKGDMKDQLGGKGAGLAQMSLTGVPVPPGFTIVTDVCNVFFDNDKKVPADVDKAIWQALEKLEAMIGKKPGDLEIADAFDQSGSLALSLLGFRLPGTDAATLSGANPEARATTPAPRQSVLAEASLLRAQAPREGEQIGEVRGDTARKGL